MPPVQHFVLFCVLACVTISLAAGCNSDDSPAGDAVAESTTTAPETDGETSDAAREPEAAAAAARTTDPQATVDPEDGVSFDADPFVDPAPSAAAAGETPFAEPFAEPAAEPADGGRSACGSRSPSGPRDMVPRSQEGQHAALVGPVLPHFRSLSVSCPGGGRRVRGPDPGGGRGAGPRRPPCRAATAGAAARVPRAARPGPLRRTAENRRRRIRRAQPRSGAAQQSQLQRARRGPRRREDQERQAARISW